MAERAYEPKAGVEGLVIETFIPIRESVGESGEIEFDREPGESFVVGDEATPWPYTTDNAHEQAVLDGHPLVKSEGEAEEEPEVGAEVQAEEQVPEQVPEQAEQEEGER